MVSAIESVIVLWSLERINMPKHFPTAPLLRYMDRCYPHLDINHKAPVIGVAASTYSKYATGSGGITSRRADEIATTLGIHPIDIWGWQLWTNDDYHPKGRLAGEGYIKKKCRNGHSYTLETTGTKTVKGHTRRVCLTCKENRHG